MTRRYLVSGPFRLDLVDERLWRGGEPAPLRGKAFGVLRALMETPQTLLTKDELFERVWPGVTVSESVLTSAMKDLRRALEDDARQPRVIETVHGRGYRFLLPVDAVEELPGAAGAAEAPSSPKPPSRRWLIAGGATAVVVVAAVAAGVGLRARAPVDKSVAVLPFEDLSAGRDQAWFADGLTEEVSNTLARTPDLRVVSRRASARFKGSERTPVEIARELGVGHLLQGSARRSKGRLRVSVSLIRAVDGANIWSETYDGRGGDMIAIQENIAFDIARALKTVMEPAKLRAMVEAGTRSVEAYEAYLRGVALEQQNLSAGDLTYARQSGDAFEQARALDPNFAMAHWRAAQSWYGNATRMDSGSRADVSDDERRRQYLLRLDRAIATSHDDVERLKYQSAAAAIQLHVRDAHRLLARYLKARPRDVDGWDRMSDLGGYAGDRRSVAMAAQQIHDLSMRDGVPLSRAITASVHALDVDGAVRRADEQLALRPDNATTQYQAHRAYLTAGKLDQARAVLLRVRASSMNPWSRQLAELRQACAEGRVAEAQAFRRQIEASGQLSPRWQAAQVMGDTEGAEAILRGYDRPEGMATLMQFMVYPSFDTRPFPNLTAHLVQEGVVRPAPVALPYACKPA